MMLGRRWMAANTTVSTFALGTLGSSIWQMGFKDAALTILFFNLFPTLVVAYFSTWGPKTGLRQLALSRWAVSDLLWWNGGEQR